MSSFPQRRRVRGAHLTKERAASGGVLMGRVRHSQSVCLPRCFLSCVPASRCFCLFSLGRLTQSRGTPPPDRHPSECPATRRRSESQGASGSLLPTGREGRWARAAPLEGLRPGQPAGEGVGRRSPAQDARTVLVNEPLVVGPQRGYVWQAGALGVEVELAAAQGRWPVKPPESPHPPGAPMTVAVTMRVTPPPRRARHPTPQA